ncbi:hypothetical protein Pmani_018712 [Petrolisthes manimaculis]|uniref:Uncharacterized protein n=1 Tax=Petrolisthes manimaculis TaxID=1843537 RepID=A0AAE1U6F5_9EUCA|nr:hypothetical protein Pmani_018712 [Petrolisthes manimaculis]
MDNKRKLESFEMWIWRRMMKISWREHRKNEDVLREVEEERNLNVIKGRQKNWIGHVLKGEEGLLREVMEGRYHQGKRARGRRRRKVILDDLRANKSYMELKRLVQDRGRWRRYNPLKDLTIDRTLDDDNSL